jgi:hypothetical protein
VDKPIGYELLVYDANLFEPGEVITEVRPDWTSTIVVALILSITEFSRNFKLARVSPQSAGNFLSC